MNFESFEKLKLQELSEIPCLEVSPLTRLENHACNVSDSIGEVLKNEPIETSVSFKGSMKLPPISREAIEGTKPLLDFLDRIEKGIVGENDKLLATTEGYVIANWDMGEIYGGTVTERGAFFQPKMFSDKIKVYRDAGTGLLYVQEPSGHLARLMKVERWKREGMSYVYKNYFGHEVAIKW